MNARFVVTDAELAQARRESGWTEHRVRIMGLLYNSGRSAAQTACLIGGVTRNAVIGKVHRKGLTDSSRPLPEWSIRMAKGAREKPLRLPRHERPVSQRTKDDGPPPPNIVDAAIPIEQRRSLLDLTETCCRWPVGDPGQPEFFYCGAVVIQEEGQRRRPYCPSHMRRAHQPWQRRAADAHPKSKLQIAVSANVPRR